MSDVVSLPDQNSRVQRHADDLDFPLPPGPRGNPFFSSFVNHPDYVKDVLTNHYEHFLKGAGRQRAKRFLGEGLLLSEGDLHRKQRRLAQPAFHRPRLEAYAREMAASSVHGSCNWKHG
jgi:cytochrome P450